MPPFVRHRRLPASQGLPAGATIGYVSDVIHTRDVWMHRVDLERATGLPMSTSAAEAAIVSQVVRDPAGLEGAVAGPAPDRPGHRHMGDR